MGQLCSRAKVLKIAQQKRWCEMCWWFWRRVMEAYFSQERIYSHNGRISRQNSRIKETSFSQCDSKGTGNKKRDQNQGSDLSDLLQLLSLFLPRTLGSKDFQGSVTVQIIAVFYLNHN
ncbi:hypothetical protein AM592_18015 [Bacillus gobiensis]|uniref:Uncharacterized protein n=1 Tax=Bacillus gobiensis TaxID=1441095 RepID=A0A0M4FJF7_9BACI|nr:hypothetical protein AM592_18015 [Bacillus gobiensis]